MSQDAKLSNQNAEELNFTYRYDDVAGNDVDIYIVGELSIMLDFYLFSTDHAHRYWYLP